ncbi:uncharacterized protein LOC116919789 [Daphnia magna]|uniref:uncharacterized protein LOC116919789 n=1 Tax=Daphnia magna TaxID=35525 RepID=UPI001E1BBC36|nr:uncharacterized protein LOC116919789 [Daphnia magna]
MSASPPPPLHVWNCDVEKLKDSMMQNFLVTSSCDKRWTETAETVGSCSLENNQNNRLLELNCIKCDRNRLGSSETRKQHEELRSIPNVVRVIRSPGGHVLALYRQSEAQKQLYKRHSNVLLIHLLHSANATKTLLAISIVDSDSGVDYTVCLVTLPVRFLSEIVTRCLRMFISHNDPSAVKAVVVNREELLPNVRKAFPMADHLISESRMLEQVSDELSKYALEPDIHNQYCSAFAVCCSTSCEKEFGYAEASLISAPGGIGVYFETTWFEHTDIWRAIENLRRIKKGLNYGEVSKHLYRKLAQTMFF